MLSVAKETREDWVDFTQDVTLHGVRYVYHKEINIVRRVVWMVLIIASIVVFGLTARGFMTAYGRNSVDTKISYKRAKDIQFPTITICNRNLWMSDAIENAAEMFGDVYYNVLYDIFDTSPTYEQQFYNKSDPELEFLNAFTDGDVEQWFSDAAPSLNSTFLACMLVGKDTDCSSIFERVRVPGGGKYALEVGFEGYCFQFNSDGNWSSSTPGKAGGLRLHLSVHTDKYSIGPNSYSEGFAIMFHEPHEVPLFDLSTGVMPGVESSILLHKDVNIRLPPPAEDSTCFDSEKKPNPLLFYTANYSFSGCMIECETSYIINKCGCRDLLQPDLNDTRICKMPEMMFCSAPELKRFKYAGDGLQACDCPEPCKNSEFLPKVSHYRYPNFNYMALMAGTLNEGAVWTDYVRRNELMVHIYFGKMSYQILEEVPAYTFITMIANVGGTLGFCIGASLLTLCEFVEFSILVLIKFIRGRRGVKQQSSSTLKVAPFPSPDDNIFSIK